MQSKNGNRLARCGAGARIRAHKFACGFPVRKFNTIKVGTSEEEKCKTI